MTLSTFPAFLDLPFELREMIWKYAVRPLHENYAGIHDLTICSRFKLTETNSRRLKTVNKAIFGFDNNSNSRSACMWDHGLWTACKHSRAVMMAFLSKQQWLERKGGFLQISPTLGNPIHSREGMPESNWKGFKNMAIKTKALATEPRYHKHRELIIYPFNDAVRLDYDLLRAYITRRWNDTVSLNWRQILDRISWLLQPKLETLHRPRRNIIIEFDPTWIRNMPPDSFDLGDEDTPRGFLFRLLSAIAINRRSRVRSWRIWLVDRTDTLQTTEQEEERRGKKLYHDQPQVFFDCCEELEEADAWYEGHNKSPAASFLRKFDRRYGEDLSRMRDNGHTNYGHCDLKQYLGILVPRKRPLAESRV